MSARPARTGIGVVGDVPWGTHFCHFYETKQDLLDTLLPYFKAGLENNEFCFWVVAAPIDVEEAQTGLRQAMPEVDRYLASGNIEIVHQAVFLSSCQALSPKSHIEIVPHTEWYLRGGAFVAEQVINGWNEKLGEALAKGYVGMRANGNEAWLNKKNWKDFLQYERALEEELADQRIIVLCSYPLSSATAREVLQVVNSHQFAVIRRMGNWEVVESAELKEAKAQINRLNEELELRVAERTRELVEANENLRREIAERRRAEEVLRQSESDLAEAQRVARLGNWGFDIATNTVRWSEQLYRIFDVEKKASGVTYENFLSRVHPDDRARVLEVNAKARSHGEPFEVEYRITTRGGELKHIREVGYARSGGGGTVAGLFGTAQEVTDRKRAEERLERSNEELRALSGRLHSVREEEGIRIAREIHDELGSVAASFRWELEGIEELVSEVTDLSQLSGLRRRIGGLIGLADTIMNSIGRIASELRPIALDELGLGEAIEWHARQFQDRTGIIVTCGCLPEDHILDGKQSNAVFRIFQEALTNILRHAQATRVEIGLRREGDEIVLVIRDNGRGIDEQEKRARSSLGLLGMHERAHSIGATVSIEGAKGQGTLITLRVPVVRTPIGGEAPPSG